MSNKALIIIDVQNGMFNEQPPVHNGKDLLHRLNSLLKEARHHHIPVIYVQHNEPTGSSLETGSIDWQIHSDIAPLDSDMIIQKHTPDSFHQTNLHDHLQQEKIDELMIAGIQTEVCVDTTCRRAFSLGYKMTLVLDAHSTFDTNNLTAQQIIDHHNQTLRWFAKVKPTTEIFNSSI
ncbi:cysteine hydrolase family protein [Piscibacillus halophilus]|uniref:cysteine hydrolase family protein n=1 Tax=Piscibacillus halophilus TaxID=571933 RepID=UPI00158AC6DB|nr:cysteine hydrolase family protein [Piscibacillus halophilus]